MNKQISNQLWNRLKDLVAESEGKTPKNTITVNDMKKTTLFTKGGPIMVVRKRQTMVT